MYETIKKFLNKYNILYEVKEAETCNVNMLTASRAVVTRPPMVILHLSNPSFRELVEQDGRLDEEAELRMRYPAVANAYEQYQLIIGLVKNNKL